MWSSITRGLRSAQLRYEGTDTAAVADVTP